MRPEAKDYRDRIMEAFLDGRDELIRELHREITVDHELYMDVWSGFATASLRRRLKQIINDQP